MIAMKQNLSFSAALFLFATITVAQTTAPTTQPMIGPLADSTLQMLHDRRDTLKDFQGKVVYDVYHPDTDDHEGKTGKVDFLIDPTNGPQFSVHFTEDTADGKPVKRHEQDLVFDGRNLTMIDRRAMRYDRQDVLPAGEKPGAAVTLKSQVPLPIGIPPAEVKKDFDVTVEPSTDANTTVLKLIPHPDAKANFDFKQLDLTVDKQLQLPLKIVRTDKKGVITTVEFKEPVINTGKSTMIDTTPPKEPGWDIDIK
jgi:hypothetical protein